MIYFLMVAGLVGSAVVIQGGLNRELARGVGLSWTLFFNSFLTLAFSGIFWLATVWKPQHFPQIWKATEKATSFQPMNLAAAFCGFLIITGMPWVMDHIGALKTLIIVIAVQLISAGLWDKFVYATPISGQRIVGGLIALIGAIVVLRAP